MAITLSYSFSPNTKILSAQVNDNFTTLSTRALDKTGDTMTGDLKFTDATYDIGKSGATRPRDGFFSRNVAIGGTLAVTGATTLTGAVTSNLIFTDATYDIGASGATRPRHLYLSGNATIGGTATITGGQVAFPATQAASADANTLDDYEEGSWTPVLGGAGGTSGQSYTTQLGRYIKVGKLVHCFGNILFSAKGTITGNAQIQGLPFPIENTTGVNYALHVSYWSALAVAKVYVSGIGVINTTTVELNGAGAAATGLTALTTTDIDNTTDLRFSILYRASA